MNLLAFSLANIVVALSNIIGMFIGFAGGYALYERTFPNIGFGWSLIGVDALIWTAVYWVAK